MVKRLMGRDTPVIPVVRLSGVIGAASPLRPGLSLQALADPLAKAFAIKAPAVAIVVNSPGGAPVQAHLIHDRIRQLADENDREVIVVIEDVGASGGYLIACAGDTILAHPSSVVGSIGVVSAGFGFDKAIEKFGIERRVYTSGDRKVALDPFQPENPDDVKRLKALQKDVHQTFLTLVKTRRADRLNGSDRLLFSGEFWSGLKAHQLGLVDGLVDLRSFCRARFGDKVTLRLVNPPKKRLLSMLSPAGAARIEALPEAALETLEERAHYARFGL
ncbi:MAG: S49 family peptidase [Hyphomicrobiaceae bacterium]|nr:S49 family peptidase [Hyphomicrobiaceae bacterium]